MYLRYLYEYISVACEYIPVVIVSNDKFITSQINNCCDCKSLIILNDANCIEELLNERPMLYGTCMLVIINNPSNYQYDVELMVSLQPQCVVVLFDATGASGSIMFHNMVRKVMPSATFYGMWPPLGDTERIYPRACAAFERYICTYVTHCMIDDTYCLRHYVVCCMVLKTINIPEILLNFMKLSHGEISQPQTIQNLSHIDRLRVYYINKVMSDLHTENISTRNFKRFLYEHNVCSHVDDYCNYIVDITTPLYALDALKVIIPYNYNYYGIFNDNLIMVLHTVLRCLISDCEKIIVAAEKVLISHCQPNTYVWMGIKTICHSSLLENYEEPEWHILGPVYEYAEPLNVCIVALSGTQIRVLRNQKSALVLYNEIVDNMVNHSQHEVRKCLVTAFTGAKLLEIKECAQVIYGTNGTVCSYPHITSDCVYMCIAIGSKEIIQAAAAFCGTKFIDV